MPTITKIERPDKSGAYYHNENVFVHATVDDLDGDELTIEWYLDVPDPTNMSTFNFSDLIEEGTSKFDYKFPVGQHTLTLYVTDEMELDYKTRNYKALVF